MEHVLIFVVTDYDVNSETCLKTYILIILDKETIQELLLQFILVIFYQELIVASVYIHFNS